MLLYHLLLFDRLPIEGLVDHAQEPVLQEEAEEAEGEGTEREADSGGQIGTPVLRTF